MFIQSRVQSVHPTPDFGPVKQTSIDRDLAFAAILSNRDKEALIWFKGSKTDEKSCLDDFRQRHILSNKEGLVVNRISGQN